MKTIYFEMEEILKKKEIFKKRKKIALKTNKHMNFKVIVKIRKSIYYYKL
jgi:hypothetical protein